MASLADSAVDVGLAHPGHEEDLVVHGQAEEDAHDDDRQEADDRSCRVDAQRCGEESVVEDEDDRSEGGEDGQEEPACGLDRHCDRPEDHHEQDDGQADDEDAEGQQRLSELIGDVDLDRGGAGHGGVEVVVVLDLRAQVPQPVDGFERGRIVGGGGRDDLEQSGRGHPGSGWP